MHQPNAGSMFGQRRRRWTSIGLMYRVCRDYAYSKFANARGDPNYYTIVIIFEFVLTIKSWDAL